MKWDTTGYAVLRAWQRDRCGICGCETELVMDHDHSTGNIRGWLCRGCNIAEAYGDAPLWDSWRNAGNPAAMLGIVEEYRYWPGHKAVEEAMREPVSDADLDAMADAMQSGEGEWAVVEMNRRADEQRKSRGIADGN